MDWIIVVSLVTFCLFMLRSPLWLMMWARTVLAQRVHWDNSTARVHEEALLDLLEMDYPGIQGHIRVLLRRGYGGWVCIVNDSSRVYTWGVRPNLEKMSQMLKEPVRWHMRDVKARELALQILGSHGVQQVQAKTYFVPSGLSKAVQYLFTPYSTVLYLDGKPHGSFCLQASGEYPSWDVVLSRILMVRGSELDFLWTANYNGPIPSYFARPMTRERFAIIYGEEALKRWDTYTSSTPTPVTKR